MDSFFLPEEKIGEFTEHLSRFGKVYRYEQSSSGARLRLLSEDDYGKYSFPEIRAAEPAKFLFIKAKRKLAEYFDSSWKTIAIEEEPKVIIGLKGCDLAAIKIWDNVFRDDEDYKDPFYISARENTLLVGADCTSAGENCFCNLLGNKPFPAEGEFDLSISPVDGGYVVFIGSERGKKALDGFSMQNASQEHLKQIENRRNEILKALEEQNSKYKTSTPYRELVEKNPESPAWAKHGETCVSCAACTYVCPTCFCFQIYDKPGPDGKYERFLVLDSCKYPRFSFMAGGLNPRGRLVERFKHRYNHKFFHYHWRYEQYACTGCGRCIENCMGKIDMRETLKDIEKQEQSHKQ
ncbi:4Fe-4S dicluster domain-containing protein [bacterium]|nr:4Fe-4S dicluster domain-containing protein [bacterium]